MSANESSQEPSYDLPAPSAEAAGVSPFANPEVIAPREPAGEQPQRAELPQVSPPPLPITNDPVSTDGMLADSPIGTASSTSTPPIADDTDLIEKEWVEKAKAIVEQTREDPRRQNQELSKFKAEYIKKRYDKELPASEQ